MQPQVQIEIALCRGLPAKVHVHGLSYQLVPGIAIVPEQAGGTEDGVAHLLAVEVRKGEARSLAGVLVVRTHGIAQAARLSNHGQRAVAHGNHLGEAARLEKRGHEEQIRAGVHAL